MARFVFACDSFKGTISSARAAKLLEAEAHSTFPDVECLGLGVADGGEGTVDAVVAATGGTLVSTEVEGPLGAPVTASYGLLPGGRAVIEMAAASGITLVYGIQTVTLSGGVFMNRYLLEHALPALESAGFTAAVNRDLPPNDGCISFGQAVVAWARNEANEAPCEDPSA